MPVRSQDSNPGEVDLHGLYVKEAVDYTDRVIEAAKRHGETTIKLIVGSPVSFLGKMVLRMRDGFVPRSRFAFQWRGCQSEARHRGIGAKVRTRFFTRHPSPELSHVISPHRHDMVVELDPNNPGVLVVRQRGMWYY